MFDQQASLEISLDIYMSSPCLTPDKPLHVLGPPCSVLRIAGFAN